MKFMQISSKWWKETFFQHCRWIQHAIVQYAAKFHFDSLCSFHIRAKNQPFFKVFFLVSLQCHLICHISLSLCSTFQTLGLIFRHKTCISFKPLNLFQNSNSFVLSPESSIEKIKTTSLLGEVKNFTSHCYKNVYQYSVLASMIPGNCATVCCSSKPLRKTWRHISPHKTVCF